MNNTTDLPPVIQNSNSTTVDASRVPLVSLAGVTCLSDVLLELPIPTPLPEIVGGPTETLYFHQRVAEEANRYIDSSDPNLVTTIANLLSSVDIDNVVLKSGEISGGASTSSASFSEDRQCPILLQNILHVNPRTFDLRNSLQNSTTTTTSSIIIPPKLPNSAIPQNPDSATGDEDVPEHLKHLFTQQPIIQVERFDIPSTSTSNQRRIVSIGKEPNNSNSKKKKTMLSELFDSLTPAAEYFAEGSRRRRTEPKNYSEYEALLRIDPAAAAQFAAEENLILAAEGDDDEFQNDQFQNSADESSIMMKKSHHHHKITSKNRSQHRENEEFSTTLVDRPPTPNEVIKEREVEWQEIMKKRREKRRRRFERGGTNNVYQMIDPNELVENESFRKFCAAIDTVFDNAEEIDVDAETVDDEDEIASEWLIPKHVLNELCSEANKLKILGGTNRVPVDRLTKLITVLEKNVKDGAKLKPTFLVEAEKQEQGGAGWREAPTERVIRSADAALIALTIMTSPSMPKQVFIEDMIELCVAFVKYQLENVIFPAFDPLYRFGGGHSSGDIGGETDHDHHKKQAAATTTTNKRTSKGGAGSAGLKNKTLSSLYGKLSELIGCFADLVEAQTLTDTTVLQLSSLGVTPFFVEGIGELQLHALRLLANIFARYEKHRKLILEDILASLARLPSTKRGMRTYRLNTDEYIQMVSALIMRLVQSVVQVSSKASGGGDEYGDENGGGDGKSGAAGPESAQDAAVLINTSFDTAMRTAHTFLSAYLRKCTTKSEEDHRPLFEAFVEDLLTAVHKPDWPAAELCLSLLGNLLVQYFSNKQIEMPLRVASLDYLGTVASRLRKDSVAGRADDRQQLARIVRMLTQHYHDQQQDGLGDQEDLIVAAPAAGDSKRLKIRIGRRAPQATTTATSMDKVGILQKALVDYLREQREHDSTVEFAKNFYIAQWYKDCANEPSTANAKKRSTKPPTKDEDDDEEEAEEEKMDEGDADEEEASREQESEEAAAIRIAAKKQFILSLNESRDHRDTDYGENKLRRDSSCFLSKQDAAFVVRYLASKRPLSQSFDIYLAQILRVLNETAVAVRTRAMKCLSTVVEADPSVLGRADIQQAVHARLLDQSSSVREAAVDLIGKFIGAQPDFIDKYYKMISDRILDTGISVRKRVIKILKDICERRPDSEKVPEICVRILRRANDEESVRKLVVETFHGLWFVPVRERDTAALLHKVMTIIDVISAYGQDGGGQYDGFEALLCSLLKKDAACEKGTLMAAGQIVNCLVENVLSLEEKVADGGAALTSSSSIGHHTRLLSCLTTLYLFSKVRPPLLVAHAETLQPYLLMTCNTRNEQAVMVQVIKILEMVVPLMEHPSPGFLAELEDNLIRLSGKFGPQIIQASIPCLSAVVNGLTKNYQLVQSQFFKMFGMLTRIKNDMESQAAGSSAACIPPESKPPLLRSLFTLGLFCRYFDLDASYPEDRRPEVPWKDQVFRAFVFFTGCTKAEDVKMKALAALGALCVRHPTFMFESELKRLYCSSLIGNQNQQDTAEGEQFKWQVLKNIELFLKEEEAKLMKCNDEWDSSKKTEDLKELGESASGLGSSVIQHYLRDVQECYFHPRSTVRVAVCEVVTLTLQQGLVHPAQCIPHVIAMQTDTELSIRVKADKLLKEVESKYPGFVQTKAIEGIRLSFRLQTIFSQCQSQSTKENRGNTNPPASAGKGRGHRQGVGPLIGDGPRGLRVDQSGGGGGATVPQALNSQLYASIRSGRVQRRAFLRALLKMFDESSKASLEEIIYVADNLASFPYQIIEEPLFICHHVDVVVSVSGASLVQAFQEGLLPKPTPPDPQVILQPSDVIQMPAPASAADQMLFAPGGTDEPQQAGRRRAEDKDDDDNDDEELTLEDLMARLPCEIGHLEECISSGQGCLMLLSLKQYLKDVCAITDSKLQEYSPSESAKAYDKALNRRPAVATFAPRFFSIGSWPPAKDLERRYQLCQQFLEFKQLTMSVDAVNTGYGSDEDDGPAALDHQQQQHMAADGSGSAVVTQHQQTFKKRPSHKGTGGSVVRNF